MDKLKMGFLEPGGTSVLSTQTRISKERSFRKETLSQPFASMTAKVSELSGKKYKSLYIMHHVNYV